MEQCVFRANDIRGKVGVDFAVDDMGRLVGALCAYCRHKGIPFSRIVLARDGRTHSPAMHDVMAQALVASGVEVCDLGLIPTPIMQFMAHTLPVDGGIMITASHNGAEYNGCKILLQRSPLCGQDLQAVASYYTAAPSPQLSQRECCPAGGCSDAGPCDAPGNDPGRGGPGGGLFDYTMSAEQYIAWIVLQFPHLVGYPYPLIFDCGNGAAGAIMPRLIEAMEWPHAKLLYGTVDGSFPHHEADPTVRENMEDCMREVLLQQERSDATPYPIGIGFDGDGDRMGVVTARGRLLTGDQLLALFAQSLLGDYPGARIVYDSKCSLIVSSSIQDSGGFAYMAPSGHAIIREYMDRYKALLGGELSGHFFFADRYFGYDDGIYASLRLIELVQRSGLSLDDLVDRLPVTYATREWRIPYADVEKFALVDRIADVVAAYPGMRSITRLDGVRVATSDGWWLLRASNTQPVICIRAESDSRSGLCSLLMLIRSACRTDHALWEAMEDGFDHWGSLVQ